MEILRVLQAADVASADDRFLCSSLSCSLPARDCLERQRWAATRNRASDFRGYAGRFPTCTDRCHDGSLIRAAVLGPGTLPLPRPRASTPVWFRRRRRRRWIEPRAGR